jgi:AAA+ ATPase superfamily predicted ATPase
MLARFARDVGGLYYQATRRTEADQLAGLSRALGERFQDTALLQGVALPDWERLLAYTAERAGGERCLLVLDEFTYLADAVPALPSILQAWFDHAAPRTRMKVVLSGSHISAMHRLEQADQPLYGRRTRRLVLEPFGVRDVARFVPNYPPEDRLRTYGVVGGLPGHLSLIDPERDLGANGAALLLDPAGRLADEAQHMLDAFLADAAVHYSIIEAIATGDHTWKGITSRTGRSGGSLLRPMEWLTEMHLIERVVPITEAAPNKSKRTLYRITDPYLGFWHRFVAPLHAVGSIGLVEPEHLWRSAVAPRLDDYMGPVFESACRQGVRAGTVSLSFVPGRVGEWWDSSSTEQLDIVALGGEGELFVGECKWGEVTGDDLANLARRAAMLARELGRISRTELAVFSGQARFAPAVLAARDAGRVMCYSREDIQR